MRERARTAKLPTMASAETPKPPEREPGAENGPDPNGEPARWWEAMISAAPKSPAAPPDGIDDVDDGEADDVADSD